MSVHRKLPSLSQPCTMTLHSASRGLMSLNTHIAGNDAQCIFQFMITPPPLLMGNGLLSYLISCCPDFFIFLATFLLRWVGGSGAQRSLD